MTPARPYAGHASTALLMLRLPFATRELTWEALEEFAGDLDRAEAEDGWQADLLNAVEREDER